MALAATPALNTDNVVTFAQHTQLDGLKDTPSETTIDVFLPVRLVKVGLLLWEIEWVDTTVEVRILPESAQYTFKERMQVAYPSGCRVASHHDDWADRSVFRD